jgi:hypothetical protein
MKRDNHYEAAFEAYLRVKGVGYVAVDEAKRTLLDDADVKSVDFILVGPNDARLVVDVKGRRFPGGSAERPVRTWQNWVEMEDVDGLIRWAALLGTGFRGVFAFVYHIVQPFAVPPGTPDAFLFRDATYLMRAIAADDYRSGMRRRSLRWGTVHLPTETFRRVVKPFSNFLSTRNSPLMTQPRTQISADEATI